MPGPPVYEMLWDCKFCGAKKLLGLTHRHCPNCGAQQDANGRYFPPDSERIAVQDHEYVGADIVCHYCGSATSRRARCCGNCGAPLTEGQGVAQRVDQVHAAGAAYAGQSAEEFARERSGAVAPAAPTPKKRSSLIWVVPLLLGVLVLCGGGSALLFWKKQGAFSVAGYEWKRAITIETFSAVSDSAWCDALPAGAGDVRRHREERSKKQVADGETCSMRKVDKGDGTFHETKECTPKYKDEPVYDDKCDYRVNRWHSERIDTAQGKATTNVNWPASSITRPGSCVGCEREGARTETYTVVFQDSKAEPYRCDFPQTKWASFSQGSHWKGAVRLVGTLDCDSLAKP
jgi:hypothetical protein